MNKIETAHDVFWLARYAHNTLDPLITAAKQYEPSATLSIEMSFHRVRNWSPLGMELNIISHWDRGGMFLHELGLDTKAQVTKVAAKVQEFIDVEQAKIEEQHDLEAFYGVEEDTEAEARDWELRQDRLRERADIERAEHDHDIELQNIAAGN